jgi:hypothetical protein
MNFMQKIEKADGIWWIFFKPLDPGFGMGKKSRF